MADANENPELKNIKPHSLVTEDHVKKVLAVDKGDGALLDSWELQDFTRKGDNYSVIVTSLKVTYKLDSALHKVTYIVKINPCRNMIAFDGLWRFLCFKEVKFYTEVLPQLNGVMEEIGAKKLAIPKCYHGTHETGQELIFLEDQRPYDFKMFDRQKGMDVAHLRLVLEELGRLHAASIILNDKYKSANGSISQNHEFLLKDWMNYDETQGAAILHMFGQYIDNTKYILHQCSGYEKMIEWIESLRPQLRQILGDNLKSSKCNVICHGDCWNNNLLFRYDKKTGEPTDVMFLDLQLCRYASPASDLDYVLYSSVESQVRKPNLERLLDVYYKSFKGTVEAGHLSVPFTEEDLALEFKKQKPYGAVFAMMLLPIVLLHVDDVPDMSSETEIEKLVEKFKNGVQKMLGTNDSFKPRYLDTFEELIYCDKQ